VSPESHIAGTVQQRWAAQGAERQSDSVMIAFWLILFVAAWTLISAILNMPTAIHGDMAEAYVWGREFQFGYYKHPPFWAWIAGAWFQIFPADDWSFELLCVVNAAIGLLGSWALVGNFATGPKRVAATVLLLLTPYYTVLSMKYNANTIFLSVWPWTLHFFVQSFNGRRVGASVWFGVMMAIAMLSKYYAVILVITCIVAAVLHPDRKKYFQSAAPYISVVVSLVLFAPHVLWLVQTGFMPFHYVGNETGRSLPAATSFAFTMVFVAVLFQLGVVALILWSARRTLFALRSGDPLLWSDSTFRFIATLAICPVLLTAFFGVLLHLKISINMAVGIFSLVPLLLIDIIRVPHMASLARNSVRAAIAVTLGILFLSPVITYANIKAATDVNITQPRKALAAEATRIWEQFTGRPLAYVAGSDLYADAIAFYSPDHPHDFIAFDERLAPWVTARDIQRHGLLAACVSGDQQCLDAAARFSTPGTKFVEIVVSHSVAGHALPSQAFTLVLIPPAREPDITAPVIGRIETLQNLAAPPALAPPDRPDPVQ
jgi:4-amino-4-deoxy-L-arabinose transferase-like glycosyltransferase